MKPGLNKTVWMTLLALGVLHIFALVGIAAAQNSHHPVNAGDLQWGPAPASFPAGAELALLDGDPASEGAVTLRLKFPAGYDLPAHWHPTQENVTVLSGVFHVGTGDKLDKTSGTALEVGGFVAIPAEMNHFAWTEEETIVQVHFNGPFEITYVDPATDPRNQ